MKSFAVIAALAGAASAQYYGNGTAPVAYVTETVDVFTTVCPSATVFTQNGKT